MDWDQYARTYPQLDDKVAVPPLLQRAMSGSSGSALDLGCGEGALLTLLRDAFGHSWELSGFEVSPTRAEAARSRGHHVALDEGATVPFPPGSFDLVISTHVIEHAPDDHAYARTLREMAKPGGLIYVETPVKLPGAWYFRRNPQAGWVLDPTHLREYRSAAAVNEVLRSAGLEILDEDLTKIVFPLAAAERLVRRMLHIPPQTTQHLDGLRATAVPIPRYRQQAVLARRPT
ncbi:class I SAM-dependent methyltransferase [Pseudonocardia hispaniensis]|uniref:Class I SAM-dependent methyltransferase n=1 Tax=Pseudonocardia hispaniensis TaxID=904933 RepID=A0ABW1J6Y4_9PSEU